MKDSFLKGILLAIALWMLYFTMLLAGAHNHIPIAPGIGGFLLFFFWIPQLSYSLPIMTQKNLCKTRLGFKIFFIFSLLLNITGWVFLLTTGTL